MEDDNTLFNQTRMDSYIEKYKKEFNLTNSQKETILNWNKKLQNGELKREESNYFNFAMNILVNLLSYEPEDFEQEVKMGRGFADFVIKKDGKNFIVIELKGSDADLDKRQARKPGEMSAVEQGFFYANKSSDIKWIIVSNYNEFRLYNRNIGEDKFIKFRIDELKDNHQKLKSFLFTFSKFSLLEQKIVEKLASKTQFVDREFENEFYKLYNETRLMLIAEIEHIHPQFTRDKSVHYAQLILNRYIFICFSEDMGLLPSEISVETIENPVQNDNLGRSEIWHRLNSLFLDVDKGNPFKKEKIFGYNGGLFLKDLEFLKIRDIVEDQSIFEDTYQKWNFEEYYSIVKEKLDPFSNIINPIYKNLMTISTFNFKSEVDVNILGHIFENSIGDIEELKLDSNSRRKQEGIFYTPEHITDYICRNTIIPYLSEKDSQNVEELIIEYSNDGKIDKLENKLMNIKIIDIACGSGAFLNKASDILLEIHNAIYDYKKEIERVTIKTKGGKGKSKIKTNAEHIKLDSYFDKAKNRRKILKNNIYGVDLNEESVEITKLALFLKIAQKKEQLPKIDKNIKWGNSIINDKQYTEKPFNWKDEFKEIFDNGGFDIVIGNPPYVRQERIKEIKPYLKDNFEVYSGVADLFVYFFEKGLDILKENGMLSFICSDRFTMAKYGENLRKLILKNEFLQYIYHSENIFESAAVLSCTTIIKKRVPPKENKILFNYEFEIPQSKLDNGFWSFEEPKEFNLREKIENETIKLKNIPKINIYYGIKTGYNDAFVINENMKNSLIEKDSTNSEIIKPLLRGKDIEKWKFDYKNLYLIFTRRGVNIEKYPSIKEYLMEFKEKLMPKNDGRVIGRKPGTYQWYEIQDNVAYYDKFEKEKIIWTEMTPKPSFLIDNEQYYLLNTCYMLTTENENYDINYILALLNSNLLFWIFKKISPKLYAKRLRFIRQYIEELPIFPANIKEQNSLIDKVKLMLKINKELINEINGFKEWLQGYGIEKFSKKLELYYELSDFEEFRKELKKKKIDTEPRKIRELFKKEYEASLNKIKPLQTEIRKIDDEINQMVYELYGLTDEEIEIIENSLNN